MIDEWSIHWGPEAYLYQIDNHGVWCHAFMDNGNDPSTVLGASWMMFKDVVFDVSRSRLGVIDANCPEYWKEDDAHFFSKAESLVIRDISEDVVPSMSKLRVFIIAAVGVLLICVGLVTTYRISTLRRLT